MIHKKAYLERRNYLLLLHDLNCIFLGNINTELYELLVSLEIFNQIKQRSFLCSINHKKSNTLFILLSVISSENSQENSSFSRKRSILTKLVSFGITLDPIVLVKDINFLRDYALLSQIIGKLLCNSLQILMLSIFCTQIAF